MAVADLFILSFAWIEIKRTIEQHDDKWTEKTGNLVSIKEVKTNDQLMIINKSGITIRTSITDENIRVMGRATQGVKLIKLSDQDEISSVAKIENLGEEEE